jgi:CheY-like chemotaxis protein
MVAIWSVQHPPKGFVMFLLLTVSSASIALGSAFLTVGLIRKGWIGGGFADADRRTLLLAAVHELRQGLGVLVMEGADENVRQRGIAALQKTLREAEQLLEGTTTARERAGEPMDLAAEITTMVRKRNRRLAEEGSRLSVIMGAMPDIWIRTEPASVKQAVGALIDEALEQSGWGSVKLSCTSCGMSDGRVQIRFSVYDTGTAENPARSSDYFSPARASDHALEGRPGSVLSLALAGVHAKKLGGRLKAEKLEGQGTCLSLAFKAVPCRPNDEPPLALEPASAALDGRQLGHLSAQVVDDNPLNLFVLKELLKPYGFAKVTCAEDGETAAAIAAREPVDVVLLDLVMPGVNGFVCAERIRTEGISRGAAIVAVSGRTAAAHDPRLAAAGIDAFVAKPVLADSLQEALGEAMRKRYIPVETLPAEGHTRLAG